jgi:hypothetical protein
MNHEDYKHIPAETVNEAVLDAANGNRPLLTKGRLQRRIQEIQYDRMVEQKRFETFEKSLWRVKE